MIHLGDITKLRGDKIPIVDVITGGSPCQDLSVAGKRAGLDGERSGLFMEQVRLVKEMREHDRRTNKRSGYMVRPRYMVWENVAGAFSSGKPKGADFQAVLTEIIKITEPRAADVPLPKNGKWPHAGYLYDELGRWSVAWRLHDAQYWGVPQRRKRIALVADFGGLSAGEILFEREGLRWYPEESGEEGQAFTGDPKAGAGAADSYTLKVRGGRATDSNGKGAGKGALVQTEKSGTIGASQDQTLFTLEDNGYKESDTMYTLNAVEHHAVALDQGKVPACIGNGQYASLGLHNKALALNCMHDELAVLAIDRAAYNQGKNAKYDFSVEEDKAQPLVARGPGGGVSEQVGALCARDYKGVGVQYVREHKIILNTRKSPKRQQGKDN